MNQVILAYYLFLLAISHYIYLSKLSLIGIIIKNYTKDLYLFIAHLFINEIKRGQKYPKAEKISELV